jgi:signal peptidase
MIPLTRLTHPGSTFVLLGGIFLPLLAQNMLASSLALVGGPVASIAYFGTLKAFEWYSPILPDSPWIINTFAVTLSAVIGLLVIQSFYEKKIEPPVNVTANTGKKSRSLVGWAMAGITCVVIIFATSGALGFRPTLVGSGSMGPALDVGDIAVITEVSAEAIGEGDIIQFVDGRQSVIHRVVEVQETDGSRAFITQGDGNDSPDLDPVYANQIQGRVEFRIPKVGWIAVGIKSLFS